MPLRYMMSLAVLALIFSATAEARLLLVTSQESALYHEFLQGLNGALAKGVVQELDVRHAGDLPSAADLNGYGAIVAAGVDAAKALAEQGALNKPVLYTMLPGSSYQWLGDNKMLAPQHKLLQIDQPLPRYLQLVRAVVPDVRSLGYLYGDTPAASVAEVRKGVEALRLDFIEGNISGGTRLADVLKESFQRSDAVLLLPDPYLYNRRVVQEVLLASFRYKRPLVVYSESFAKAGAMVALFSTPEQVGRQTAEMMACLGQPCFGAMPQRSHPKYFSVMVNEAVARQLGVDVKSAAELQRYLESLESGRGR